MKNTPTLWKDMTDAEKGTLLLAHHDGAVIEFFLHIHWRGIDWQPRWKPGCAYRIKPKAPKVETFISRVQLWDDEGVPRMCHGHYDDQGKIANITHTYTITDGIVTACDTIIHKNEGG
jgi:hypothetical protein